MGDALRVKSVSPDIDFMDKFEVGERVLEAYDRAIEVNPKVVGSISS